jgi:uncharacterized protein with NRDE domain
MFEDYPLIVAANRDEHYDRPSAAPCLLASTPKIIAGRDLRAGGTWLGVNDHGLMAGILNRRLDGQPLTSTDVRSRGLLCMDVLNFESGRGSNAFIHDHRFRYNPFTLLFADKQEAYVSYNDDRNIITQGLEPGLHVFSSAADFDLRSAKADRAYSLFAGIGTSVKPADKNARASIEALQAILADHSLSGSAADAGDAICVHRDASGTVSSTIIYLSGSHIEMYFCPGPPCRNSFGDASTLDLR